MSEERRVLPQEQRAREERGHVAEGDEVGGPRGNRDRPAFPVRSKDLVLEVVPEPLEGGQRPARRSEVEPLSDQEGPGILEAPAHSSGERGGAEIAPVAVVSEGNGEGSRLVHSGRAEQPGEVHALDLERDLHPRVPRDVGEGERAREHRPRRVHPPVGELEDALRASPDAPEPQGDVGGQSKGRRLARRPGVPVGQGGDPDPAAPYVHVQRGRARGEPQGEGTVDGAGIEAGHARVLEGQQAAGWQVRDVDLGAAPFSRGEPGDGEPGRGLPQLGAVAARGNRPDVPARLGGLERQGAGCDQPEMPKGDASPAGQALAGEAQGQVDGVDRQRPRPRLAQAEALQGEGRPEAQVHRPDFRNEAVPRGLAPDAIPDRPLEGRGPEPRGRESGQEGGARRGHEHAHPPARESHGG